MKVNLIALIAAGATLMTCAAAEAREGCGVGAHRGPRGICRPNRIDAVVAAPGLRVGVFYPGRGYWYGGRYWAHRYRWQGGWRYR